LIYKKLNTRIEFKTSEEFGHIVLFTGDKNDNFVCIENQTCSTDAINLSAKGYTKESGLQILNSPKHKGFIEYVFIEL